VPGPSRGRARSRLMLLVLSAVTLLTLDFRSFGPLASVQRGLRAALNPLRDGTERVLQPVTDAGRGIFDYRDLKRENDALRQENEQLKGQQIQGEVDAETLKRLLEQNDIPYVGNYERVVARVVAGSVGNFDEFSVEIDKGSSSGLAVDMPVVTSAGLVGRLVEVDAHRSRVQLITSPQFAVGVRVAQDHEGRAVVAQGAPRLDDDLRADPRRVAHGDGERRPARVLLRGVSDHRVSMVAELRRSRRYRLEIMASCWPTRRFSISSWFIRSAPGWRLLQMAMT